MTYTDPQAAARAWVEQNGWYFEDTHDADVDVAPLEFGFIVPAEGRQKERRVPAMYGSWPGMAARLMSTKKIVQTDDGWVLA